MSSLSTCRRHALQNWLLWQRFLTIILLTVLAQMRVAIRPPVVE